MRKVPVVHPGAQPGGHHHQRVEALAAGFGPQLQQQVQRPAAGGGMGVVQQDQRPRRAVEPLPAREGVTEVGQEGRHQHAFGGSPEVPAPVESQAEPDQGLVAVVRALDPLVVPVAHSATSPEADVPLEVLVDHQLRDRLQVTVLVGCPVQAGQPPAHLGGPVRATVRPVVRLPPAAGGQQSGDPGPGQLLLPGVAPVPAGHREQPGQQPPETQPAVPGHGRGEPLDQQVQRPHHGRGVGGATQGAFLPERAAEVHPGQR